MVVSDFDFACMAVLPLKTDSVLLINAYAVLVIPVTPEAFQTVSGRHPEFTDFSDSVDLIQLSTGHGPDGFWAAFSCSCV